MNMHYFSVIIPVYNGEKYIRTCLQSLANQNYPLGKYEIIIVDNNSTDAGIGLIEEGMAKIVFEGCKGSYAARNRGIKQAVGDIIAFTDIDCQVAEDWLKKANINFQNKKVQIVSGAVEFIVNEPLTVWGSYDQNRFLKQEFNYKRNSAATANLFVRKNLFDTAGLFDADLQSSGDVDWVHHAVSNGASFSYAPQVKVYHPVRNNFMEVAKKCFRVGYGRGQLGRKNRICLFLLNPKHLSPGWLTLKRLVCNPDKPMLFYFRMITAVYLLNTIEYAGKVKGYLNNKKSRSKS